MAAWSANFFLVHEARALHAMNLLFLLALAIVALMYAIQAENNHAAEVFILLTIGLCLGMVSIMDASRYSKRSRRETTEGVITRTLLVNIAMGYSSWFWWSGLDTLQQTPCGTFVLAFVKVELMGKFRIAMKVLTIVPVVWRLIFTTVWEAGMVTRNFRPKSARVRTYSRCFM
jgi:hypothetical protein